MISFEINIEKLKIFLKKIDKINEKKDYCGNNLLNIVLYK
jgi:hypothetical protein